MIVLRSDNRVLIENTEFSYLVDNYASGVGTITIINTDGFFVNDFIIIEEIGKENAEMFRINAINNTTGAITLSNSANTPVNTVHSHSESTKVHRLPYNQVQFYWTPEAGDITDEDPVFGTSTPLGTWIEIDPSSWYTTYSDNVNSTGFGWFKYQNSVTSVLSPYSNPIPYGGFEGNTVAEVFADFDSMMNTKELSLIGLDEKFRWLNEALALIQNKLNLNNTEYFVSLSQSLTTTPGVSEYILPNDFSDMVSITNSQNAHDKRPIGFISINKVESYNGSETKYYLRNRYLGFAPAPVDPTTYYYTYRTKSLRVDGLSDYIDLPDNAYYALKDFMLYRSNMKFTNPIAKQYQESFVSSVNLFVETAVKRDANLDSWEPDPTTVV